MEEQKDTGDKNIGSNPSSNRAELKKEKEQTY
jgi:hypothetical protein